MIFTGTQLSVARPIYTQTGTYGFSIACTVDNTTGIYRFGMSGNGNTLEFKLDSGKMYYQNQFIHTYRSNEQFLVEAQFTSGHANVVRNGAALVYGDPKSTGNFDYFYFNRANVGMNAAFDLQISGNNTPLYSLTTQGYLISSGQGAVTGWFINQSAFPIKIFNSSIQASQEYTFGKLNSFIGSGASGSFVYSGDFSTINLSQPVLTTFNTSFNDISILFYVIDANSLSRFINLTGPNDFAFNAQNVLNRDVSWLNYSGGFAGATYPTSLTFQLNYFSGQERFTGIWNMFTGVDGNSLVSMFSTTGRISGSGLFSPNSSINWQVTYSGVSGNAAQLIISGDLVTNPINSILNIPV